MCDAWPLFHNTEEVHKTLHFVKFTGRDNCYQYNCIHLYMLYNHVFVSVVLLFCGIHYASS